MSTITAGNVTVSCSLSADTTGNLVFQSGGNVTAMTIDTSQNVGIGTSSPVAKLNVSVADGGNIVISNTNDSHTGGLAFGDTSSNSSGLISYDHFSNAMRFQTNGSERARIDSSGALLVNTTTATGTVNFSVAADTTTKNPMSVNNTRATASTDFSILFYRAGNIVGSVQTSLSATSYVTSSDYRLKENVQPMAGALAKVAALKPCTYQWKSDGTSGQGFIAHELAEVCPDAVTGEKDAVNEDGSIKPQGIDTSFLVATLTAAIQELKAELDATKAEVAALKGASA